MKNTCTFFVLFVFLLSASQSVLAQRIAAPSNSAQNCDCPNLPKGCYKIPVIIHIIHHPDDVYPNGTNISCDQVCSQMAVLNDDFLKKNDISTVIPFFTGRVGKADISFYMHEVKRIPLPETYDFPIYDCIPADISPAVTGPINNMIPLNIWVSDIGQNNFASVLATTVTGTDCVLPRKCNDHGIFVDLESFGNGEGYDLAYWASDGRVVTHEVGHWLGLRHVWGGAPQWNNPDCDCVYDTPTHDTGEYCSADEETENNYCNDLDGPMNLQNFMNYSSEPGCRVMFTKGQASVMRRTVTLYNNIQWACAISIGPAVSRLSGNPSSITISPNPVQDLLNLEFDNSISTNWNFALSDVLGKVVKQGKLQSSLDLSFLQNGLYIIHFYDGKNLMSQQKVLKVSSN